MDEMALWHDGMMMIKMIEEGGGMPVPSRSSLVLT